MRKVFSSHRLENVEAVAELLRTQEIEVKITDGRSYHGNRRSTFSYRAQEDTAGPQASVWIVRAEDQPRGRQLLRDAGLLESSRAGESTYLPLSAIDLDKDGATAKARRTSRLRMALLGLIAIASVAVFFATRKPETATAPAPVAAVPAPPPIVPELAGDVETYRANVPTALARLLIEREIDAAKPGQACIAIDDQDPAPAFIQGLGAGSTEVFGKSACPSGSALAVVVHDYMTDGSGTGTVQLGVGGKEARSVEVEREGTLWRILRER